MATIIANPQLGVALALTELLKENPDLPTAGWTIDSISPALHGFVHDGGMVSLALYAEVLGGSIRAANSYEVGGQWLRRHVLKAVWRDVRIEVVVALPEVRPAVAA